MSRPMSSPSSFRRSLIPGRRVNGHPGCAGRRARQPTVVEVPDLIGAFGELPAIRGALVAVVVDGVVRLRAAAAEANELLDVGTAGRGVARRRHRSGAWRRTAVTCRWRRSAGNPSG